MIVSVRVVWVQCRVNSDGITLMGLFSYLASWVCSAVDSAVDASNGLDER